MVNSAGIFPPKTLQIADVATQILEVSQSPQSARIACVLPYRKPSAEPSIFR